MRMCVFVVKFWSFLLFFELLGEVLRKNLVVKCDWDRFFYLLLFDLYRNAQSLRFLAYFQNLWTALSLVVRLLFIYLFILRLSSVQERF